MRSYEQYCAVAKALDVVGDRWTLLIVRELLLRGSCRYTDLRHGLPGIATNLLVDRMRELEDAGIVRRFEAPPPIATTLYELTPRGRELAPVLHELGHWGSELMTTPPKGETFRSYWLVFPIERMLMDGEPDGPPFTIELRTGDEPVVIEAEGGRLRPRIGSAEDPDVVMTGPPPAILGLLTGRLDLAKAKGRGLKVEGDLSALRRVRPVRSP